MTQEEWDRASPEKRVLHQFLAAMADTSHHSGRRMREAILELVAEMPPELRAMPSSPAAGGAPRKPLTDEQALSLFCPYTSRASQSVWLHGFRAAEEECAGVGISDAGQQSEQGGGA
jgi:hypothetical protein